MWSAGKELVWASLDNCYRLIDPAVKLMRCPLFKTETSAETEEANGLLDIVCVTERREREKKREREREATPPCNEIPT